MVDTVRHGTGHQNNQATDRDTERICRLPYRKTLPAPTPNRMMPTVQRSRSTETFSNLAFVSIKIFMECTLNCGNHEGYVKWS